MTPEILEAIQRAKTCAPARCSTENVCFILATELERLYGQLNDTKEPAQLPPQDTSISFAEPTYDAPVPLWGII